MKIQSYIHSNSRRFYIKKDGSFETQKQAVVKKLSTLNATNINYAMFYIAKESEDHLLKNENGEEVKAQDVLKKGLIKKNGV